MALINNIQDVKKHVTLNFNFTYDIIAPYVVQAERKYVESLIGTAMYDDLDTEPTDAIPKKVHGLLQEAAANFAVFKYLPIGAVNISDGGITVNAGADYKSPEWYQYRDIQRTLLDHGYEAIDAALKLMEANASYFASWTASENYTVFKELFVTKTEDFQRFCNINESRRTFMAMRPFLLEAQYQYFGWVNDNTKALIKTGTAGTIKTALEYARAAQVNFAFAKAVESGLFLVTPSGLFLRILELKGDKSQPLSELEKQNLMAARNNAGNEFIKRLKEHLNTNAATFPDYTAPETGTGELGIVDTKSTVSF